MLARPIPCPADLEQRLAIELLPILAGLDVCERSKQPLKALITLLNLKSSATMMDIQSALNCAPIKPIQLAVDRLISSFQGTAAERKLQLWLYSDVNV